MTVTPLCECNACANCEIRGWAPGTDVQDVSFRCVLGLAREEGCRGFEPGDPWEEIKRKEQAWKS